MTVTPQINPNVTTYAARVPYITAAEYVAAPTAVAVKQLSVGQGLGANAMQLDALIARASSWVDSLCYQVLAATRDIQYGQFRIGRDGYASIPLDRTPILEIDGVSWGYLPGPANLSALTDLSGIGIGAKVIKVPLWNPSAGSNAPNSATLGDARMRGGRPWFLVTYVNGYPNTLVASAVAAGATVLPVGSALGIYTGSVLTVYDDAATEQVQVLSVAGANVTLTAPLLNPHIAGISVSALPPVVKQAAICLTSALIKSRGSDAVIMQSLRGGGGQTVGHSEDGGLEEVELAIDLLKPFERVR